MDSLHFATYILAAAAATFIFAFFVKSILTSLGLAWKASKKFLWRRLPRCVHRVLLRIDCARRRWLNNYRKESERRRGVRKMDDDNLRRKWQEERGDKESATQSGSERTENACCVECCESSGEE